MLCKSTIFSLAQLASLFSFSTAKPLQKEPRATGSLDSYIATESPFALQGVLNNIGPDGADASAAAAGIVIASPSKTNPDCKSTNYRHIPSMPLGKAS